MKNDELVIMGIYPHESQDLVSVVVLSNDGNIQARSVIQYEGLEAVNFLDDLKNRPLWKHVDAFVIYENLKSKEISCDPSYPDVCIPVYPPDLDCGEIQFANFKVLSPDPHGFDRDKDGIGCES